MLNNRKANMHTLAANQKFDVALTPPTDVPILTSIWPRIQQCHLISDQFCESTVTTETLRIGRGSTSMD